MGIAKFAFLSCRSKRNSYPLAKLRCPVDFFCGFSRSLSSNAVQEIPNPPNEEQQGLGARLSFVVQELENIQKQKAEKISAHEKLRLWRNTTNIINDNIRNNTTEGLGFKVEENEGSDEGIESLQEGELAESVPGEIAHPWPEWLDLMEMLLKQRYFDKNRGFNKEDDIVEKLSGGECTSREECVDVLEEDCVDVFRDMRSVRKACLDFARDRFDILRFLSRKNIQILVGFGCPSIDKKVVLAGKRLRAYAHLDEGDVCSSCKSRNSCQEAYILPREEEAEARTMDVMRLLTIYGLDPLINSAENKLHKKKVVKMAIRKLLKEVVRLGAVPIDPNLPKPVIKRLPPKVKEPQPPPRKRVGRDDVEMKKGDWLCPKCDFLNFAKNSLCLQCEGDRPRRLLNPGEWECPGCNFLNYRRNMQCYNCDHKRPEDDYTKSLAEGRDAKDSQQLQFPNRRMERPLNFISSSKTWNDDFDDDESDGAEVASFEYGDNSEIAKNPMIIANRGRKDSHSEDDSYDFDDSPMQGSKKMKPQKEDDDLEIDMRRASFNHRVNNFNQDGNEDASYSSLSRIQRSRSHEGANMHSTNSRRNSRGYDSEERLEAYQTKDSKKFATPSFSSHRGKPKKAHDSFDEDSDDDSFVSESDNDETEWKKGNRGRSMGGREGREWNRKDKHNSSQEDSDDEVSHLSRKTGKGAKFTGRVTSFSSRGRHGFRNEYGFENDRGAKSDHGSVSGRNRAKGNLISRGVDSTKETRPASERGEMLFGPRRGTRVKSDTDFECELHNKKSRNGSSKRSPRSSNESSFRSRGGRTPNSHVNGYVKEGYKGKINKASENGRGARRGRNDNSFVRDTF